MYKKISPRLGIKSSNAQHVETLLSAYVLWKVKGKPHKLAYGVEDSKDGKTALLFTQEEVEEMNIFLSNDILTQENTSNNPLLTLQIEALQVCGLNVYKCFNLEFQNNDFPDNKERTGGSRFLKSIMFTSVIDLLDGYLECDKEIIKDILLSILTGEKFDISLYPRLKPLLTFLFEQTQFNDSEKNMHELYSDIKELYSFHENGPSRILKNIHKKSYHQYSTSEAEEFNDYKSRAHYLNTIFSPNYESKEDYDEKNNEVEEDSQKLEFSPNLKQIPLNLLLKGVPGTGKSRAIDEIIKNYFDNSKKLTDSNGNVINRIRRLNLHSATTNSTLMQGVSVESNGENISYNEKTGTILDFLLKAVKYPHAPFALILEEIQENNLNSLIGDLIYLIEDTKRAKNYNIDPCKDVFDEIRRITEENSEIPFVNIPNLITSGNKNKRLFLPSNLFIFCTSNYREDQKVIEDNLLRRFEVIELYPTYKESIFQSPEAVNFLKSFNEAIISVINDIHSDRYLIGHSSWLKVNDKQSFCKALLKLIIELKDIREIDFELTKEILMMIDLPFNIEVENLNNYQDFTQYIQSLCQFNFIEV